MTVADGLAGCFTIREKELRGKTVLFQTSEVTAEDAGKLCRSWRRRGLTFQKAGVLAVMAPDRDAEQRARTRTPRLWGCEAGAGAGLLQLGMEDAKLPRAGPGDAGLSRSICRSRTPRQGATTVNNVVAEIRGSERPDEWILDPARTWTRGTSARAREDNGTGADQRAGSRPAP